MKILVTGTEGTSVRCWPLLEHGHEVIVDTALQSWLAIQRY